MRLEVSKVCRSSLLILAVAHLGGYVVGQVKTNYSEYHLPGWKDCSQNKFLILCFDHL